MAKAEKYSWEFQNVGGTSRVKIRNGADIANLDKLDTKLWTVLSCPVNGLEIDSTSLSYIDANSDGKIRVSDIVTTSKWITSAIKNHDLILEGKDCIDIEEFDKTQELGANLYASAKQILENLGKEGSVISIADAADMTKIFAQTRFNGDGVITENSSDEAADKAAIAAAVASFAGTMDRSGAMGINADIIDKFYGALAAYDAWKKAEIEAPFGADTDAVIAA